MEKDLSTNFGGLDREMMLEDTIKRVNNPRIICDSHWIQDI